MNRRVFLLFGLVIVFIIVIVYVISTNVFFPKESITEQKAKPPNLTGKKVTVLTNPPHAISAAELAKWFHDATGAVVQNVVVGYDEALDFTLDDLAKPTPNLDVIMLWYVDLGALVEKKALVDLTDFIASNSQTLDPDDYIPSLYDPYTLYNGRRWAIPYDGDTHVLFYRKSLLAKYNFKPPVTWNDFLDISRTITEGEKVDGLYGTAIMAPPIPIIIISSFMNRLGSYGGMLLDKDGRPNVKSPEALAALGDMVEQSKYALPTPLQTDWEVSRDAFLSGRVAMVEQWTDIGVMAEDPTQSIIQGDWGVVQMPKGDDSVSGFPALNAGFSIGISSRAPHPEVAREYLLFAGRPDITLRLNLINGGIDPTRISVLNSDQYKKFAPELSMATQAAIKGAAAWPTIPKTPFLLEVLSDEIILALEGRKSPEAALADADRKWREVLGASNN